MTEKMQEKLGEALHEMYRRAFAVSTPPVDWDEMLNNAGLNSDGEKIIPFMDHECELAYMSVIVHNVTKEYKIPTYLRRPLATNFWLGCSPKTKITK